MTDTGFTRIFPGTSVTLLVIPSASDSPIATPVSTPIPTVPQPTAEPTESSPTATPDEPGGTIPTATPTQPAPTATPTAGVITGRIFVDVNGDGEITIADQPLRNVVVSLTEKRREIEMTSPSTTGADGIFRFTDVPPGEYLIRFELPSGYIPLSDIEMQVTMSANMNVELPGFGVQGQSSDIYLPVIK